MTLSRLLERVRRRAERRITEIDRRVRPRFPSTNAMVAYETWALQAINDEMETVTLCNYIDEHMDVEQEEIMSETELRSVDG